MGGFGYGPYGGGPYGGGSAYNSAEDVLTRLRAIVNDSEVPGGDILTDAAPFTFTILNGGYERVQLELAKAGIETFTLDWWLIGLPIMPTIDPEARMVIDDTGCNILYPNSVGNVYSAVLQLPTNLVLPTVLSERQTATTNSAAEMNQPNGGITSDVQQLFLGDWEWKADGIRTRGALQSQDLKIVGEAKLPQLTTPSSAVPIRGVINAAAYYAAMIFAESRGGIIAPEFKAHADEEIFLRLQVSARRRQHKQVRRRPFSGRGGRRGTTL
jgi:hypothetical protein